MNDAPSTSTTSGGINASVGNNLSIGQDAVGRDKIVSPTYNFNGPAFIVTDSAAHELLEAIAQGKAQNLGLPTKPPEELVYELQLTDYLRSVIALSKWRLVTSNYNSSQNEAQGPSVKVDNGVLDIGRPGITTFYSPPIAEIDNLRVECDVRILDDGNNQSNWAGIRVRGFLDDIRFGYLIYLRRSGSVELYRGELLAGEGIQIVPNTQDEWTNLKIEINEADIKIWVNGVLHIDLKDNLLQERGLVYLHTLATHSQFRNFRIHKLSSQ
jgi:hypothetical protein